MKLKELRDGEEFPSDFWNYNINPILGYKAPIKLNPNKESIKYSIYPIKKPIRK